MLRLYIYMSLFGIVGLQLWYPINLKKTFFLNFNIINKARKKPESFVASYI